jgi:RimJ/RimL family protein N-acetyltransferase
MEYTVELLGRRDIQEYLALTAYIDAETDFLGSDPKDNRPSLIQILNSIKGERQVIFVAKNKHGLIGHLGGFWRRGKNARLGHCMNVGLGIAKDFWGNGIGTAMMEAFEAWAQERKIVRLELEVMVHNERAVALYKKRGFVVEGTKRKSIQVGDTYVDEYLMAKILE